MNKLLLLPLFSVLCGCPAMQKRMADVDRSYGAFVNVTDKTGGVEFTLTPAATPGQGKPSVKVRIEGSLADGKQVFRAER